MAEDRDLGYDIAFEEAVRAISDQQTALDALTTRAGLVASTAAVVVLLSGREILEPSGPTIWLKMSLIAYLGVALATGYIIWPRRKWRFHFSAARLHWLYLEGPDPLPINLLKRDLALHLDAYSQYNARQFDRLSWALGGSIALLLAGTAALIYDLWT